MGRRALVLAALLALAWVAWRGLDRPPEGSLPAAPGGVRVGEAPRAEEPEVRRRVHDVTVLDYGRPVLEGTVDLGPTLDRIRAGERFPHGNDGAVFSNREGLLPRKPRGYYREYVHPTPGVRGPGPQRLVSGAGGEWYYTPDHYRTFIPLHRPARSPP